MISLCLTFCSLKSNLLISLKGFIIEHLVQKLGKCPKAAKLTQQMSENSILNSVNVKKNSQLTWQMSKNELVNLANAQKSSIDYANVQKKFVDPDKCQRKVYSTRQMTKNCSFNSANVRKQFD